MSTDAEVRVELRGATVVAVLSGEVDMANASYVQDELLRSVPNDAVALVIDLTPTRYLDSAAMDSQSVGFLRRPPRLSQV